MTPLSSPSMLPKAAARHAAALKLRRSATRTGFLPTWCPVLAGLMLIEGLGVVSGTGGSSLVGFSIGGFNFGGGASPAFAAPGDRGVNRFKNRDNNDEIRRQVRRYEDEIEALRRQLGDLDSQIKSAKEQVQKADKEAEPFLAKVEEAQKQLDAAKAAMEEVRKAQNQAARDSQETLAQLQSDAEKSPEMKEARAGYEAALTRHNTRRDALLADLRANPRYRVVLDELAAKRQQRDETAGKPGQSKALAEIAEAIIALEARMQEFEREALAQASDWPEVEKARKESLETMTAIRSDLLRAIPDSPPMAAAKQALKDIADRALNAQKTFQAAQKTLTQAKSEAARSERKLAAAKDALAELEKRKVGAESLIARKRDSIRDLLRS